ncbi:hypothetical protein [Kluyvera georgiana]|uniref:hypothetical protein n=1 Tax=Kluyvera georgiana TaxID=73098 RepID=UPI003D995335
MTAGIATLSANAHETLEASKETATRKRAFNGTSSTFTNSPSFLRKFVPHDRAKLQENMTYLYFPTKKSPACRIPETVVALLMPG